MRISDWSSDVCSSDLPAQAVAHSLRALQHGSVFYREQVMSESRECVLVLDLEATCCDDSSMAREEMEIIEIGAVMVERATLRTLDEFPRSEERRRGKGGVSTCRSWWWPYIEKTKTKNSR